MNFGIIGLENRQKVVRQSRQQMKERFMRLAHGQFPWMIRI